LTLISRASSIPSRPVVGGKVGGKVVSESSRSRKVVPRASNAAPPVVGMDLGGTYIRAALADEGGALLERRKVETLAREGVEAVVGRIVRAVEEVGVPGVAALGICSPGPLSSRTGIVYSPPNLHGWSDVPLAGMLEERLGIPVFLGNDANAAALGEFAYGAGRGYRHVIYITVSTGVGGGIISDGRLLEGQRGAAGEVGHVIVEPDGPLCGCGNRGCLEALISGTAIARQAREALAAGRESVIGSLAQADPHGVTAEVVVRAAREGDRLAGELLETAGRRLGTALLGLVHVFDPQVIVVGGGVTNAGELLMKPARDTMFAGLMPIFKEGLEVVPPDLGADAGLYGAVALARRTVGVRVEDT